MDKHFLEFWGNFLISVAKGQQQLEDLAGFLKGDFTQSENLAKIFFQAYGLESLQDRKPDFQSQWEKSIRDFRESYRAYLHLLGAVPREDYEALQAKVADQEETIMQLRLILEEKGLDYSAVTRSFQELLKKQTQTVQDFLSGLADLQKKRS
ncbi:MAG: hypothetical protein P8X65_11130 [Syntrophobacterales bacterium]